MFRSATFICLGFVLSWELGFTQQSGLKDGYILVAPMGSGMVHLIDSEKQTVHSWDCGEGPGNATYLEKSGSLLRTAKVTDNSLFSSRGGGGGRIRRFSWEGELLWDYQVSDEKLHHHHDVEPMPNGNVLVIAWERHTADEAIAAGRDPDTISGDAIWTEMILELKPIGSADAEIVWKWRLWDHLIQEFDDSKPNFGVVADHPGKVDFNYGSRLGGADWIHMNAIDYNEDRDEIALSARWFNEGWIIDHSTTTEDAASSSGGQHSNGGDLIYRWGNPAAYQRGDEKQRLFFLHHDLRWIDANAPGAGNFLIFNNGDNRAGRAFSSVDEFVPPLSEDGTYLQPGSDAFAPDDFSWSYQDPELFHSDKISGAQRLPNGNTLVCSGAQGWIFEVTPEGDRIWELKVSELSSPSDQASESSRQKGKGTTKAKGKGKGKSKGGGGGRGSAFRAPWYPSDYTSKFADL
ncbi:MAG: aryl-sulfate sulfotransferase [Verrucomicrobiota bacterium]